MKDSTKHLEDLTEIRSIMERSTRFLSLSGWSGILAGFIALIGTALAFLFLGNADLSIESLNAAQGVEKTLSNGVFLLVDAAVVLFLALLITIFFSFRKASRKGEKIWSPVTRRLLMHLSIPLITGALIVFILIMQGQYAQVAALTLIFYGLALVSAGKYTNQEIIWLGLVDILLGLAALVWPEYGLYFWAAGFGVLHLLYGITLYYKYDRQEG